MSVLAKFTVKGFESTLHTRSIKGVDGKPDRQESVEKRTVILSPVYSSDPTHENHKFWEYSPSGEIKLGTINPEAWEQFELGKDYYVEFRPAN